MFPFAGFVWLFQLLSIFMQQKLHSLLILLGQSHAGLLTFYQATCATCANIVHDITDADYHCQTYNDSAFSCFFSF